MKQSTLLNLVSTEGQKSITDLRKLFYIYIVEAEQVMGIAPSHHKLLVCNSNHNWIKKKKKDDDDDDDDAVSYTHLTLPTS